jgi:predicted DNA-binding transcriptional regulator AlpA
MANKRHERVLRLPETMARVGKGKSAIYSGVAEKTFPAPFAIEVRKDGRASVIGWKESEILSWIEERSAVRLDLKSAKKTKTA